MRKELRGYNTTQVDTFLSRCLATPGVYLSDFPELRGALTAGARVTPLDVHTVEFDKAFIGYPIRTVDAILKRVELSLSGLDDETYDAPDRIDLTDLAGLAELVQLQTASDLVIDLTRTENVHSG